MTEFEFLLKDRVQKIRQINKEYDLERNAYISFSGGKDSAVLSRLVDLALKGNKIPRVYINTGIDYSLTVKYVKERKEKDSRITIIAPSNNIKKTLEEYGYPFKSKDHSIKVETFQKLGLSKSVTDYLGWGEKTDFLCPSMLRYQFTDKFTLKVSDKCCYKLKKEPVKEWSEKNGRPIGMTGIRHDEGGLRKSLGRCTVFASDGKLRKFHPLYPCSNEFIDEFVIRYKVGLSDMYYPPYSFRRTGCKGCPFALNLQEELYKMAKFLPAEEKQCEIIWKPVYEEYRRIGFRLFRSPPRIEPKKEIKKMEMPDLF